MRVIVENKTIVAVLSEKEAEHIRLVLNLTTFEPLVPSEAEIGQKAWETRLNTTAEFVEALHRAQIAMYSIKLPYT